MKDYKEELISKVRISLIQEDYQQKEALYSKTD